MSKGRSVLHLEYWYAIVFSTLALANKASMTFGYLQSSKFLGLHP